MLRIIQLYNVCFKNSNARINEKFIQNFCAIILQLFANTHIKSFIVTIINYALYFYMNELTV